MSSKHFLFAIILAAGLFLPSAAFAATLSLSASSGTIAPGQTVSVAVFVSSPDKALNAVSGVVSFPSDILDVVSVSKSNSIATLWVQEPSYSNTTGTVSFEGVIPNPGFTGASGRVVTITFRGKRGGSAKLSFASGSVLANDGKGTELLSGSTGTTISVGVGAPAPASPEPPRPVSAGVTIMSSTHPDQSEWYKSNVPQFTWTLPAGALEVRTLISEEPNAAPSVRYAPAISSKTVEDLADGTHYFSVQARTAEGWGAVSRYRVNIDGTLPEETPELEGIEPPEIEEYTKEVLMGEPLKIHGSTYPEATVVVAVSKDGNPMITESAKSDSTGAFGMAISQRLWPGAYSFTARVVDSGGAESAETEPYAVTVRFGIFTNAIRFILNYFIIILSLIVGATVITAVALWSWFRLVRMARILKRENDEAQSVLHRSMGILRSDLASHMRKLRKAEKTRVLTKEELDFLERFAMDLGDAEKIVSKEIADITTAKPKRKSRKKKEF